MPIWKQISGTKTKVARVQELTAAGWKDIQRVWFHNGTAPVLAHNAQVLEITADTDNFNILAQAGSPTAAVQIVLKINSGVTVGSTDPANPAIATGVSWPAGSAIFIQNDGNIIGAGGAGGDGGQWTTCSKSVANTAGADGGDAIDAQVNLIVDNTSGNIYGGGGGGGGCGGHVIEVVPGVNVNYVGGGGGGGAGNNGGAGGSAGSVTAGGSCTAGSPANDGGAGGATGGAGGTGVNVNDDGGAGGGYGEAGSASEESPLANDYYPSAAGGAAGKAVELNGNSISWRGGNNGSQVKGAVS